MNKKGQTTGLAIMSAIFVFIILMMINNFVMSEVSQARSNLNCASASTISDGVKVLCLIFDTSVIYWIYIAFSVLISTIVGRLAF